MTGIATFVTWRHIIGIQHHQMDALQICAVVSCWHLVKSHHLITIKTTIRVVIPNHMKTLARKGFKSIRKFSIGRLRRAKITKLQNRIRFPLCRFREKFFEPLRTIVHQVLVNIRDQPDPHFTTCLLLSRHGMR